MKPLSLRRLTEAERGLAHEMFGEGLDAELVRLFALPAWSRAFAPGPRLIVWPAARALADFGGTGAPLSLQAVFVHELTHVWQAQNGVNLLVEKLRAGDGACSYSYDLQETCVFAALNIEQQAMVFEHAFLARRGAAAPYPAARYAQVLPERWSA